MSFLKCQQTFSIPVTLHGLLGTLDNLDLRNLERRGTVRLAFNIVGLAGLVGDVDAVHTLKWSEIAMFAQDIFGEVSEGA